MNEMYLVKKYTCVQHVVPYIGSNTYLPRNLEIDQIMIYIMIYDREINI